jgi:hypothetical protein
MDLRRKRRVVAVMVVLLGSHCLAIAGQIDHWPLSNYDMFAGPKPAAVSRLALVGVTSRGEEFALDDPQFWKPYSPSKLGHCLRDAKRRDEKRRRQSAGNPAPTALPAVIESLLAHYHQRRHARLHEGPQLAALRLYDCRWKLDPALANLHRPDRRELVCEYRAGH